jgi:hypothetical protein
LPLFYPIRSCDIDIEPVDLLAVDQIALVPPLPKRESVGSYGTRNIVVNGMMVLGATDRLYCIVLI